MSVDLPRRVLATSSRWRPSTSGGSATGHLAALMARDSDAAALCDRERHRQPAPGRGAFEQRNIGRRVGQMPQAGELTRGQDGLASSRAERYGRTQVTPGQLEWPRDEAVGSRQVVAPIRGSHAGRAAPSPSLQPPRLARTPPAAARRGRRRASLSRAPGPCRRPAVQPRRTNGHPNTVRRQLPRPGRTVAATGRPAARRSSAAR